MLQRLLLVWIFWARQRVGCEAACDNIGKEANGILCSAGHSKYSLQDMSYVPRHRLIRASSLQSPGGLHFLDNPELLNAEKDEGQMENSPVTSDAGVVPTNDAIPTADGNVEGGVGYSGRDWDGNATSHVDDHHGDAHGHDNDSESRACNDRELSWDEHCYFLTKDAIPGFSAYTECDKSHPGSELAAVNNDEVNDRVSDYIRDLDSLDGKPLHLRILYVYIKDNKDDPYRNTKFNKEEEKFKNHVCSILGCTCTALRSTTGTWHSRICDTRHYTLCKRPHQHILEEAVKTTLRPPRRRGPSHKASTGAHRHSGPPSLLVWTATVLLLLLIFH